MTKDKFDEVTESFFVYISRYMVENEEIDLNRHVKDYIKNEDRTLERKQLTDLRHFTDIVVSTLIENDYFVLSRTINSIKMYKPTKNCNERIKIIKRRSH